MKAVIPTLTAVVLIVACAGLAHWQWQRAGEKAALIDAHAGAATVSLTAVDADTPRFSRVEGTGRFLPEYQLLLDNQVLAGRAGVHVFTPFAREPDGRIFMVNRGWLPLPPDRRLPNWSTPTDPLVLSGRLNRPPRVGMRLGGADARTGAWPRLITYYDPVPVARILEAPVDERVIQLDPDHPAGFDGRDWRLVNIGPDRHRAYTLQWAAIGLAVAVIWIVLMLQRRNPT